MVAAEAAGANPLPEIDNSPISDGEGGDQDGGDNTASSGDDSGDEGDDDNNSSAQAYYYSFETGQCLNADGELGHNEGSLTECGSFENGTLEEADLKDKTLYGLNLKGTSVLNSKVSFKNIADREMQVNEQTYFEKKRNPFTSLYDQHLRLYKREENKVVKINKQIDKINEQIDKFKARYLDLNEQGKEEKAKKIEAKLLKKQEDLAKKNQELSIALAKKERHMQYALDLYELALTEPAYTNPRIKNKKFVSLADKAHLMGAASNSYFANESMSISIWFRTVEQQKDGRLVNFHKSGSGSAINLSLKKDHIILGYRNDSGNYQEMKFKVSYISNDWFHVAGTYDGQTYKLYVNGQLVSEKVDTNAGFGDHPMVLGSYDGKSSHFNGDLDELSLWNTDLSEEAIIALYNNGQATNLKRHLDANELINWWRLGDRKKDEESLDYKDQLKKDIIRLENK
jgi:hypothetical protein